MCIKEHKSIKSAAAADPFKSKSQIKEEFRSRLCLMRSSFFAYHKFKHKLKADLYLCLTYGMKMPQNERGLEATGHLSK